MHIQKYSNNSEKMFSWHVLPLMAGGVVINFGMRWLAILLQLPLYLDNIGSVIVAALGGPLPGMAVGYVSNFLGSFGEPDALYFGVLTVLIALSSAICSKYGLFKHWWGFVVVDILFILIGGAIGSVIGWFLYGGQVGGTISEKYAFYLLKKGFEPFTAQFVGDIIVDAEDKTITTVMLWAALRFYPKKLYDWFSLSYLYDRSEDEIAKVCAKQKARYKKQSVYSRIIVILAIAMIVLSILTTSLGALYYKRAEKEQFIKNAKSAAQVATIVVDGNKIDEYLEKGPAAEGYDETEALLSKIRENIVNVKYLYVYKLTEKGCYVVFDVDTPDMPGEACGTFDQFEKEFVPYREQLIKGEPIPPIMVNDKFGWLISVYIPLKNSAGQTTAYIGADVSAVDYVKGVLTYLIKLIFMEIGIFLIVIACSIWYAQKKIAEPITALVEQTLVFDKTEPSKWLTSETWRNRKEVTTGDEIQTLYETLSGVEANVSRNMVKLLESAELERKNRELAAAVKKADALNEAKTEFYSRMSHDMRTPMNGILGLVQLSKEEKDATVLHTNIHKIGEAGNYLLGLINDTLDISKLESKKLSLNLTPVYAQDLITSLSDMMVPSLKNKNISYEVINNGVRLDVWFNTDKLRLQQIFANLVSNAIKFTPKGGRVTLTLDNINDTGKIALDKFTLRDTGIGMSKEFLKEGLFHPFSQEHNELTTQYAGSGLGLAIVKNLVELMHGTIKAESELGEGTTFTITLQFDILSQEEVNNKLHSDEKKKSTVNLTGKHILLAEDNELNAEIAIAMLQKEGIVVERAQNGQVAVDDFNASKDGAYDLILMDIRMPIMDGITAAKKIRSINTDYAKKIPIIAMTANAYLEDREQTKAAGMNEHVAKPIDVAVLKDVLIKYLG